jgi:hypothetical protein
MRKLLMIFALLALPLLGFTVTQATAAAPADMTRIDRSAGASLAEKVHCTYHCHRVCAKRNYHGYCTYWTRKCHRKCYRPRYRAYH